MLKVGIIGVGNAGNQVAALAVKELNVEAIAINTSEKDLETLPGNIPKKLITSEGSATWGAGKDRMLAKEYLMDSIMSLIKQEDFISFLSRNNLIIVVSSTGGGTGSGIAPILSNLIASYISGLNENEHTMLTIGILPVYGEAYVAQFNTKEYMDEMKMNNESATYMIYDNDKYANKPAYQVLEAVNKDIVEDINVIRGFYNLSTKETSIDDSDIIRLISYPGRLVVAKAMDIKERDLDNSSLETILVKNLRSSSHAELQMDHVVTATAVIANLNASMYAGLDIHLPSIRATYGEPLVDFTHVYVNEERKLPNNIFMIMSGLNRCVDRLEKITERVEEIDASRNVKEDEEEEKEESALSMMAAKIAGKKRKTNAADFDVADTFAKFGVRKRK